MNGAAALSLMAVLAAVLVGALTRRVALAPGSREQRWFSVVVLGSAAYALFDLATTMPGPPWLVFVIAGPAVGAITVTMWGWIRFSQELVGAAPGVLDRHGAAALLLSLPVMATPGMLFTGEVIERPYPPLGVLYRQAATTPLGDATFAALLLVGAAVLVRLVRAWRRRVRHAGPIALAYAVMLAFALVDALSVSLVLPLPFLLDWGYAAPVLVVGWMNTNRLVAAARGLEELRSRLVTEVEARTRALGSTLETLHQTEKLAALGQLASGTAREVDIPAAAVRLALARVAAADAAGIVRLAPDDAEALADARVATGKISRLVRSLLDAATSAADRPVGAPAEVVATIAAAVAILPPPVREALRVDVGGAADARVPLPPDTLALVVDALLRNAVDATPPGAAAPIAIRAERRGGRVRLEIADQGTGMTPEVLGRVFEPFFTTKPQGCGAGLGLAVARGLVRGGGGTLALESAPGHGTRAIVELPEIGAERPRGAPLAVTQPPPPPCPPVATRGPA